MIMLDTEVLADVAADPRAYDALARMSERTRRWADEQVQVWRPRADDPSMSTTSRQLAGLMLAYSEALRDQVHAIDDQIRAARTGQG